MKKLVSAVTACTLLIGLAGCSQNKSSHYVKDGTFEGTADGYGGSLTVSVDFNKDAIASVEIEDENETIAVADDALKKVPQYIVSGQSVNVDVSTGATVTSKAVMAAVSDAIRNAGGSPEEWNTDATGKNETRTESLNTSVVIVGGGVSGIAAALRLEQLGINTTIVEKSGSLGGSLKLTDRQAQLAVTSADIADKENTPESPADLYKDVYAYGDSEGNEDILHVLFSNLTKTTEWQINDLGLVFGERKTTAGYSGAAVAPYDDTDASPSELLAREADICGADILMNTAMTGFLHDKSGKAAGIYAKASNGTYYTIEADYIILAAGSTGTDGSTLYYGNEENTGDLNVIAAEDEFLDTAEGNDVEFLTGIDLGTGYAIDACDAIPSALTEGLLLVNQNGERFVNEEESAYNISAAMENQPSSEAYLVMSVGAYRTFRREILRSPLINDEEQDVLEDDQSDYNQNFYCHDIRDVAKKFGIDQSTLLNTILSFNDDTEKGADSQFSRTSYGQKIDVGSELMVVPLNRYKTINLGGIRIDSSLRVISDDETVQENIYCIGSAAGGIFGNAAAPAVMNTWAFVSAKVTADAIAAAESAE